MLPAALKIFETCCVLKELVEDVHLGGVAVDTVNQHIYWTAAWADGAPGTYRNLVDLCGSGGSENYIVKVKAC